MRRIGRWLVVLAACVIALVLFLFGGLVMSSNANAHRPLDLVAGRPLMTAGVALTGLAVFEGLRPSSVGSKLLLAAVLTATAGFCVLAAYVLGPW